MAMYYYASKISAIACGTRCKQTVLQKSRGQRDRDKCGKSQRRRHRHRHHSSSDSDCTDDGCCGGELETELDNELQCGAAELTGCQASEGGVARDGGGIYSLDGNYLAAEMALLSDGLRFRRRHSTEQLSAYDLELGFQQIELATGNAGRVVGAANPLYGGDVVQYDIPKNTHKRSQCDINFESSVLGSGGIMYINGRIVSGPLDSFIEVLIPKNVVDLDKEFIFSFLLSSRLFLRPHELLGKLLDSVPDSECLESLVALLAEWTNKFPYDYRDERMMNHVKHIVARCSNSHLEAMVSQTLSALLKRLTDLERHEADLRACQTNNDKLVTSLNCPTATQYAQIVCRLEKKLAKHIGPEEFLQCSSMILLDKQKKWDQPSTSGAPPGAQDPKKTCNLETYLDWSSRLRLFVCNEILQCSGIRDRSRTVELWSGVAQYCLLVGNYNSATAILESLESPAIARLKITWSKLQVTCQQLDCMQRHAEGHGHLWQKQAIVLNEQHQQQQQQQQALIQLQNPKTDTAVALLSASTLMTPATAAATTTTTLDGETPMASGATPSSPCSSTTTGQTASTATPGNEELCMDVNVTSTAMTTTTTMMPMALSVSGSVRAVGMTTTSGLNAASTSTSTSAATPAAVAPPPTTTTKDVASNANPKATTTTAALGKQPNDWVVIPVFADIVKLALAERENCLQRLPNGHININAFDRMAAIVGAFTRHMQSVKSTGGSGGSSGGGSSNCGDDAAGVAPSSSEYENFCWHMQQTTKLSEAELMMASFDCEEPNNAEKLMYDLN